VQTLVNIGAESNLVRVITREVQHDWKNVYFQIFKHNGLLLSIEAHVALVQINTALNREGVELPFNQSYQFEVTTVPLGLHYITSYKRIHF
jgi:hypothetical protein